MTIIAHEVLLHRGDREFYAVDSGRADGVLDFSPLLKNVSGAHSFVSLQEAIRNIGRENKKRKWIISLVATPSLTPEWLSENARSGEFYVFAEHDNLTDFIGANSPFNSDSFRRKGPWSVYKPVMDMRLAIASMNDPLFCSNIGCTVKADTRGYPIMWDYTRLGRPIPLAKGIFDGRRRFVFVGDSDPIGGFLAPYNPFWLRSLFGKPDPFRLIEGVCLAIFAAFLLGVNHKRIKIVLVLFVAFIWFLGKQHVDIKPTVDVSVSSTGSWLSPHYEWHYSSLPKLLTEQGLTVSVQRKKSNAALDIQIIDKPGYRVAKLVSGKESKTRFFVLLPGASILTERGEIIGCGDLPLGRKEIYLGQFKKNLIVEDARNMFSGNRNLGTLAFLSKDTYCLATNSPQRLKGINSLVNGN